MSAMVMEELLRKAESLSEDERVSLAHRLLVFGEPPPSDDVDGAWDVEIRERIARYERGDSKTRAAGDVFAELDRRLGS